CRKRDIGTPRMKLSIIFTTRGTICLPRSRLNSSVTVRFRTSRTCERLGSLSTHWRSVVPPPDNRFAVLLHELPGQARHQPKAIKFQQSGKQARWRISSANVAPKRRFTHLFSTGSESKGGSIWLEDGAL